MSGDTSLSVGTVGLPTYYEEADEIISPSSILSSQNFGMWDGELLTVASLGPEFSSQTGNNIFFPVLVNGNGASISLSQLSRNLTTVNPGGTSALQGFNIPSAYTTTNIGIIFGADNALGGGDDTYLVSGTSVQTVNAIFSIGVKARLFISDGASGADPAVIAANQILVDAGLSSNADLESITATYTLTGLWGTVSASMTQTFGQSIPEPATWAKIMTIMTLMMLLYRRRMIEDAA